jgi:hypothetical protein
MQNLSKIAPLALILFASPVVADTVVSMKTHTDEMVMMGHTTPARDEVHQYWFSDTATRFDGGDTSVVMRLDLKKLYFINHLEKTASRIDLPFDFKSLVGPEMAPMMEQMMKMMAATVTVTPTDRSGDFAGYACKFSKVDISMGMMQMTMDSCLTDKLPIDYARYKSLSEAQAELIPSGGWMKDLAEKLKGFPVHSDTTTTMMGKSFKSWQEVQSVEEKAAPAGLYDVPAGYKEVKYDPMAQAQQRRKKN